MGFKMKGNPFARNFGIGIKDSGSPAKLADGKGKKDKYADIIKKYKMTKDEKGYWIDKKTGRTPSQIAAGVKGEQREHKLPATKKQIRKSPLKETEDITWGPEKKVKTTVTKDKGTTTTKTDYETEGKSYTPPKKTPEGDKAYEKLTPAERKKQDDKYIKANTKKHKKSRSEVKKKSDLIKIKPKKIKPIPVETKEDIKPVRLTIDQKRSRNRIEGKIGKKRRRRRSDKPGTVISRAVDKARKKAYSRRKIKRGGTKCTIGIGSRGRKPRGCKL